MIPAGWKRFNHQAAPHRESGVAAVEFALILPFLLALLLGIMEIALMLYDQAIITNASREAARAGIVLRVPKLSAAQIEAVALNYTQHALISLGSSVVVPEVIVDQAAIPAFADPLGVTVKFSYSGFGLVGLITTLAGPVQLSATTVMNHE